MIKNIAKNKNEVIEFAFDGKGLHKDVIKEAGYVTYGIKANTGFQYLGKAANLTRQGVNTLAAKIVNGIKRDAQLNVASFDFKNIDEAAFVTALVEAYEFKYGKIYNEKTAKAAKAKDLNLLGLTAAGKKAFKEAKVFAEARTWVRTQQATAPNILTSVELAKRTQAFFKGNSNIKVTVLTKAQIKANKMGLLLSVNAGSAHDARLVVIEYKGAPSSKDKLALVGKGIMFDAGGYNVKTGRFMQGMKYDMSGAAIVAGTMKAIASMKPKTNVVAVMPLTDNKINSGASTPDTVVTSMNGKTVEINNTDAEGRLVLADAITYAIRKLKANKILDIATLTGAMVAALGNTFTGVWSTDDKEWDKFSTSADEATDLVWRMPFHADFLKYMQGSKVADLKNTDYTGKGGSISAAMFLKEFTEGKKYLHLDIAGTAEANEIVQGPLIKTIARFASKK